MVAEPLISKLVVFLRGYCSWRKLREIFLIKVLKFIVEDSNIFIDFYQFNLFRFLLFVYIKTLMQAREKKNMKIETGKRTYVLNSLTLKSLKFLKYTL